MSKGNKIEEARSAARSRFVHLGIYCNELVRPLYSIQQAVYLGILAKEARGRGINLDLTREEADLRKIFYPNHS